MVYKSVSPRVEKAVVNVTFFLCFHYNLFNASVLVNCTFIRFLIVNLNLTGREGGVTNIISLYLIIFLDKTTQMRDRKNGTFLVDTHF